ncbi:uncharacterized protein MYCFIDRAFT_180384 [Pseudocercospora fijiensis CIRAD86]|uniref:Uncharacterized protein n=1 Tax=Pseudocercospora fijiensis (strain CIRAD86) TaxID=383855 RepID=M2ZY54_PSEFD|nr:uncharacterized protein MYCFIDRAFT_180384 [Pseudocercospora fijiensis CIRAD86]EME77051.1 hypothetical protein MYCFIDRAFT_180384 [Pseudocercospora fijiensis CIRAD86]
MRPFFELLTATHDTRHTTHDTRHTTHDTRHTTHDIRHTETVYLNAHPKLNKTMINYAFQLASKLRNILDAERYCSDIPTMLYVPEIERQLERHMGKRAMSQLIPSSVAEVCCTYITYSAPNPSPISRSQSADYLNLWDNSHHDIPQAIPYSLPPIPTIRPEVSPPLHRRQEQKED